MRKLFIYIIWCVCVVMGFISCDTHTPYFHYNHTPIDGWEKNDTLTYDISPLTIGGEYYTSIGLRVNGAFPFTKLYLVMEQDIIPSMRHKVDTVCFQITNSEGRYNGDGISHYQYTMPVDRDFLQANDSLHITIRHCMKRDILPGISDVGVRLDRK